MKRILFIIGSLNYGGAERQLVKLSAGLRKRGHDVIVVVFYAGGALQQELEAAGVRVQKLEKRGRWDWFSVVRLLKLVRRERPDVVYSFLGTPNIISSVFKKLLRPAVVVCGLRASNVDLNKYGLFERCVFWLEQECAGFADLVIVNSNAGRKHLASRNVSKDLMVVVHNGIDVDAYYPDGSQREELRSAWGVRKHEKLIGMVARLDPMKGHREFIKAAEILRRDRNDVVFVCVGDGPAEMLQELQSLCCVANMSTCFVWSKARDDVRAVYNAFDILVSSSSFGEGFSNVIGEAMACSISCVVTDVGDAAAIVGDTGIVVPSRNPAAIARALREMLSRADERMDLAQSSSRARIKELFSIDRMVESTEGHLLRLLGAH